VRAFAPFHRRGERDERDKRAVPFALSRIASMRHT
jgi:hypothetical protein